MDDKAEEPNSDIADIELDNMVVLGDYVCAKVPLKDKWYAFCIAKVKSMKDMTDKTYKTVSPVNKFGDLQFQVSVLKA